MNACACGSTRFVTLSSFGGGAPRELCADCRSRAACGLLATCCREFTVTHPDVGLVHESLERRVAGVTREELTREIEEHREAAEARGRALRERYARRRARHA